ncbi:MAG: 7-cyano-7-deazaguanine synthase QueC [Chloroflexi bacterium]|jgi:7-cyano-7-deazaguanine synthase|nr:7-cyano-7-deazaguanine synthase QueC [Chloroflexota bacterium]
MERKAVVLLSGGLDSSTVLLIAKDQGFSPHALTFRYGLRHEFEIDAAGRIAKKYGAQEHIVVDIDLGAFGGSALTDHSEIPKDRPVDNLSDGIPTTYVPARNTIFLSFALAWAEVLEANDIFIGVNALDYSGYPDCRPEYIRAYQSMANLATKAGIEGNQKLTIHTPLINLTKSQIIQKGTDLGMDYALTHTCYDPLKTGNPCGHCDACQLRLRGFEGTGLTDPLTYPE